MFSFVTDIDANIDRNKSWTNLNRGGCQSMSYTSKLHQIKNRLWLCLWWQISVDSWRQNLSQMCLKWPLVFGFHFPAQYANNHVNYFHFCGPERTHYRWSLYSKYSTYSMLPCIPKILLKWLQHIGYECDLELSTCNQTTWHIFLSSECDHSRRSC